MSATVNAPEPWVAMGYLSLYTTKNVRSVYYAQKAMTIDSLNIEALLMKATAFLELKQINEATNHFHAAIKRAPLRFEAYVGLTECYTGRVREAIALAGRALKTMGPNSRTLWLYGAMIAKDPLALAKAKPYLEKAMKLDPTHLNPVYVMADILKQEKQYDKGVELLRGYLVNQSTSKLHLLLGDFLTVAGDQQEALDQYNKALGIDPTNELARQGIERVENGESGADNTFDVEMEHSVSEADFDGSDVESTWSDELG